jgi:hypothetical protein
VKQLVRAVLSVWVGLGVGLAPIHLPSAVAAEASSGKPKVTKVTYGQAGKSGFHMLNLDEMARLPFKQRKEYIRLIRYSFESLERFQNKVGAGRGRLFGSLDIQDESDHQDVVARGYDLLREFALGSPVDAQASGASGSGSQTGDQQTWRFRCPDKCIYGYNLNTYPKDTGGNCPDYPLGCVKDPTCKIGRTSGIQCEPTMSGLITEETSCAATIDKEKSRNRTTVVCREKGDKLAKENRTKIDRAIERAREVFGISDGKDQLELDFSVLEPTSEREKTILTDTINNLAVHAYDDGALATLISTFYLYRITGKNLPSGVKPEVSKFLGNLQSAFGGDSAPGETTATTQIEQSVIKGIDNLYSEYDKVCSAKLDDTVVAKLKTLYAEGSTSRNLIESEALKRYRSNSGHRNAVVYNTWKQRAKIYLSAIENNKPIDNRHVYQKEECEQLDKDRARLRAMSLRIAASLPAPLSSIGQPAPTLPEPPKGPEKELTARGLGCGGGQIDSYENGLYQAAVSCVACSAEKDVHNYKEKLNYFKGDVNPVTSRAYANSDYRISRKWLSLISTMAVACGDGRNDNRSLNPDDVRWYLETFGHCDSDLYNWNDDEIEPGKTDAELIRKWSQLGSFWDPKNPKQSLNKDNKFIPEPDRTVGGAVVAPDKLQKKTVGDFARIFGISYQQATAVFCDPSRFEGKTSSAKSDAGTKTEYLTEIKGFRSGKSGGFLGARGSRLSARARMEATLKKAGIAGGPVNESNADDLLSCMQKSKELAQTVYDPNERTCQASRDATPEQMNSVIVKIAAQTGDSYPGNYVSTGNFCAVGQSVLELKDVKKGNVEHVLSLAYNKTERLKEGSIEDFSSDGEKRADVLYLQKSVDPKTGDVKDVSKFLSDGVSFAVSGPVLCEDAGSGDDSSGSGNGRARGTKQ